MHYGVNFVFFLLQTLNFGFMNTFVTWHNPNGHYPNFRSWDYVRKSFGHNPQTGNWDYDRKVIGHNPQKKEDIKPKFIRIMTIFKTVIIPISLKGVYCYFCKIYKSRCAEKSFQSSRPSAGLRGFLLQYVPFSASLLKVFLHKSRL